MPLRREDECVVVELKAVLHGRVVDLRRHPARIDERLWIASDALACGDDLRRRLARGCPFPSRDEDPELGIKAAESFFEGAADGRRHAAGVPVEAEDAAECLEPV